MRKNVVGMIIRGVEVLTIDTEALERDKIRQLNGEIKKVGTRYLCRCTLCGEIVSISSSELFRKQRRKTSPDNIGCGCQRKLHISESHRKQNQYRYSDELKCYIGKDDNGNEFLISADSYAEVSRYYWALDNRYFRGKVFGEKSNILLHRYILIGNQPTLGLLVDHINGNTSDCRLENLRLCTPSQNQFNRKRGANNKSGCCGVHWNALQGKWIATLRRDGQTVVHQMFDNLSDAIQCRLDAEKMYFGNFNATPERRQNII